MKSFAVGPALIPAPVILANEGFQAISPSLDYPAKSYTTTRGERVFSALRVHPRRRPQPECSK